MKFLKKLKTKNLILLLNQSNFNFKRGGLLDRNINLKGFSIYSASNKIRVAGATGIISSAMAIDILWAVTSLFATGVTLTALFLGGFVLGAGFLGILYAVNNYQKNCKLEEKNVLEYQTSQFKLMILEELKRRQKLKLKKEIQNYLMMKEGLNDTESKRYLLEEQFLDDLLTKIKNIHNNYLTKLKVKSKINYSNNNVISHLINSDINSLVPKKKSITKELFRSSTRKIVGESIALSSVLFASFFWSTSAILTSLGFATAATLISGPIGVGIALGISITLGVVYAFDLYQKNKIMKEQKKLNTALKEKITSYQTEYELVKNEVSLVKKMQHELIELKECPTSHQCGDQYLSGKKFFGVQTKCRLKGGLGFAKSLNQLYV